MPIGSVGCGRSAAANLVGSWALVIWLVVLLMWPEWEGLTRWLAVPFALAVFAGWLGLFVTLFMLAECVHRVGILYALCGLAWIIWIPAALLLNIDANQMLRAQKYRPGWFGISDAELETGISTRKSKKSGKKRKKKLPDGDTGFQQYS